MRVGESYGDACRYCGSTTIIVSPPSSAGHCAVCSNEAVAWAARLREGAARSTARARLAAVREAAAMRSAERAQQWSRINIGLASGARTAAAQSAALLRAAQSALRQFHVRPQRPSPQA